MAPSEPSQLLLFPISCSDEHLELCRGGNEAPVRAGWKGDPSGGARMLKTWT